MTDKDKDKKQLDYSKPIEIVKVDIIPNDSRAGGDETFIAYVRNKKE